MGFSTLNHPFGGSPFMETPIWVMSPRFVSWNWTWSQRWGMRIKLEVEDFANRPWNFNHVLSLCCPETSQKWPEKWIAPAMFHGQNKQIYFRDFQGRSGFLPLYHLGSAHVPSISFSGGSWPPTYSHGTDRYASDQTVIKHYLGVIIVMVCYSIL